MADNLQAILNEATKHATGETPNRELTEEDKQFLRNAIDSVKGHNDVVKDIQQKMASVDSILDNFEELEDLAYDIDIAYCMSLFGLYNLILQDQFKGS